MAGVDEMMQIVDLQFLGETIRGPIGSPPSPLFLTLKNKTKQITPIGAINKEDKVNSSRTFHGSSQPQQRSCEIRSGEQHVFPEHGNRLLPFRRHEGRGEVPELEYLPVRRAKCDRVELLPLLLSE